MPSSIFIVTLFLVLFICVSKADVTWSVSPFNPSAVPLAVRSPYLPCWLAQESGNALNAVWPTGTIVAWTGFAKVDGKAFKFLGGDGTKPVDQAIQKSFQITSTQSISTFSAGPVDLTVNFLSPVEPDNLVSTGRALNVEDNER